MTTTGNGALAAAYIDEMVRAYPVDEQHQREQEIIRGAKGLRDRIQDPAAAIIMYSVLARMPTEESKTRALGEYRALVDASGDPVAAAVITRTNYDTRNSYLFPPEQPRQLERLIDLLQPFAPAGK
ncbi:MAG: hypothetical protein ABIH41_02025 [Nanoarchaeota archaeon]